MSAIETFGKVVFVLGCLLYCGVTFSVLLALATSIIFGVAVVLFKSFRSLNKLSLWACALVGIAFFLAIGLLFGYSSFH